ncbi:MAG: hypothetical protein R3B99_08265 [Polyangiales bacterium]
MRLSLLALASVAMTGCFDVDRVTGGPPLGYETDPIKCSNGYDDDNDGLIDCLDPDCIRRNLCGEIVPLLPPSGSETSVRECTDGVDNDLDGQFDCGDRGCQAIRELCCVSEFDDVSCSDRIDNDGNGFADCQDFSCRNNPFVTVCGAEVDCTDDFDNDNDGRTDCEDDDCMETEVCGFVPPMPEPETNDATCTDGRDNDGNGFTDCGDFSCCNRDGVCISPAIQDYCDNLPSEETLEACMDGVDNDGNGFTDCGDFSCSRSTVPAILDYCNSILENSLERCTDGVDNDGNTFTDCEEFSCCRDGVCIDPGIDEYCRTFGERTFETCTNGVDEDENGFADCADFSCQDVRQFVVFQRLGGVTTHRILPPGDTVCPSDPECEVEGNRCLCMAFSPCSETVAAASDFADGTEEVAALREAVGRCTDGFDGDLDGFVDCEDWDCQWHPLLNPSARTRGATAPGLCQGGRIDLTVPGYWRAPVGDEMPNAPPVALLCR